MYRVSWVTTWADANISFIYKQQYIFLYKIYIFKVSNSDSRNSGLSATVSTPFFAHNFLKILLCFLQYFLLPDGNFPTTLEEFIVLYEGFLTTHEL